MWGLNLHNAILSRNFILLGVAQLTKSRCLRNLKLLKYKTVVSKLGHDPTRRCNTYKVGVKASNKFSYSKLAWIRSGIASLEVESPHSKIGNGWVWLWTSYWFLDLIQFCSPKNKFKGRLIGDIYAITRKRLYSMDYWLHAALQDPPSKIPYSKNRYSR